MDAIRFIIREEMRLMLKEESQDNGLSQFIEHWRDFVLDHSDYKEKTYRLYLSWDVGQR